MKKQTKLNEAKSPVKIGDVLYLGKRKGKVTKVMSDMANVDFGKGDVYGITFSRIKGDKIDEANRGLFNPFKNESVVNEAMISSSGVKALRSGHKIKTQNGVYTITGMGSQTNATKDFEATNEKGKKFNLRVSLRGARGIQVAPAPSLNFPEKEEMLESIVNEAKTYKKGDKLKIKLKNGKEFDLTFDSYGRQKGMAFGKFKDGSGEYDTKPFSLDTIKESKLAECNAPNGYHYMPNGELMKDEDHITEGRPIPMDTPNEFAYLDFKKHAIKNQTDFKKDLEKANGDGGKMFLIASAIWYKWARQYNKEFTHIKDKNKFGRALLVLMMKDNLIIKKGNKLTDLK